MPERQPGAQAPCPVLSWQLALGAGGAPPEQAEAGRVGLSLARDRRES